MKIKTVSGFVKTCADIFDKYKEPDEVLSFWFRGEPEMDKSSTPLVPNAYRDFGGPFDDKSKQSAYSNAKAIEGNLKGSFQREAAPYLSKLQLVHNSWTEYYLMQHYGLKTRLLDWTENILIALFHAVSDCQKNCDGVVWILNPHRLNRFTTYKICNISTSSVSIPVDVKTKGLLKNSDEKLDLDELHRRYLQMDFDDNTENSKADYFPLAIYPPLLDDRMLMQSACFTIFGNQVNGLLDAETKKDDFLGKIEIDAFSKSDIKKELKWMGISHKNILPGLEGVCKSIKDHYDNSD